MLIYFLMAIFVCGMNIIPAFMPATWIVLTFFYIKFNLFFIPTVIIGAVMATAGRVLLSFVAKHYLRPFLSKNSQANYDALGSYFNRHKQLTIPAVLSYAFLPIPSNQVFIAAGLANFNILVISLAFFVGRLISYSFWVGVAANLTDNLENIFVHHYTNMWSVVVEMLGFVLLIILSRIPWKNILKEKDHPPKK